MTYRILAAISANDVPSHHLPGCPGRYPTVAHIPCGVVRPPESGIASVIGSQKQQIVFGKLSQ